MSFKVSDQHSDEDLMAEINMTPFVDVMLVLLIIFIVTLPVIQHSVNIELPKAVSKPNTPKPEAISLSINAQGKIFWNTKAVSLNEFETLAKEASIQSPQPAVNLRADRSVVYDEIAKVLAASKRAGLTNLGFITEPK